MSNKKINQNQYELLVRARKPRVLTKNYMPQSTIDGYQRLDQRGLVTGFGEMLVQVTADGLMAIEEWEFQH